MKPFKRIAAWALTLVLLLSLSAFPVDAAKPSSYNWGTRHEICTSLSSDAEDYYTGSYTWDNLSSQSGSTLLQNLRTLMTSTHTYKSSYDDCKNYAKYTDCQNGDGTVVLLYTSYVTSASKFSASSPGWNREHVWPKSLGGFKTTGPGADLHHIRPDDVETNSKRNNNKYGYVSNGTQTYGKLNGNGICGGSFGGGYFEPLDEVKGDVARICLYIYVRYGGEYSKCSAITNIFQSVDVLLEWCELDPVDTWEMGRNDVVEEIQGNRNVFIDYPELAWQLFGKEVPENMTTPSNGKTTTTCEHKNTEIRNQKEATCSEKGYTGDTYCKDCKKTISKGTEIAMKDHTTVTTTTDATCTQNGKEVTSCQVCKKTLSTKVLPATGHVDKDGNNLCDSCGENLAKPTEPTNPEPSTPAPTEPTEPDTTDPEPTEPDATNPEPTEPDVTEPDSTEPTDTEPTPTETEPASTDAPTTDDTTAPAQTTPGGDTSEEPGNDSSKLWMILVFVAGAAIVLVVIFVIRKKNNEN